MESQNKCLEVSFGVSLGVDQLSLCWTCQEQFPVVHDNLIEKLPLLITLGQDFIEVSRQSDCTFCTIVDHLKCTNGLLCGIVVGTFSPRVYCSSQELLWQTKCLRGWASGVWQTIQQKDSGTVESDLGQAGKDLLVVVPSAEHWQ